MSTLAWIALAVGVFAILALAFGASDGWFCALFALACLLGAADTVYYDRQPWPVILLLAAAMFTGGAVHAVIRGRRQT